MSVEILIRYSGPSRQHTMSVNADGEHLQIIARNGETGEEAAVFTGNGFSKKEYDRRGGAKEEDRFFRVLRGKPSALET